MSDTILTELLLPAGSKEYEEPVFVQREPDHDDTDKGRSHQRSETVGTVIIQIAGLVLANRLIAMILTALLDMGLELPLGQRLTGGRAVLD